MSEEQTQDDVDGLNDQETSEGSNEDVLGELQKGYENLSSITGKWGNEMGEIRKAQSAIQQQLSQLSENLQSRGTEDFDPYDREQIRKLNEAFFDEWLGSKFMPALKQSQQMQSVTQEFSLDPEEFQQVAEHANAEGLSVRGAALDLFGDRKFKSDNRRAKEMSKELKKKDTVTPQRSSSGGSDFDAMGIPESFAERQKWRQKTSKDERVKKMRSMMQSEE